MHLLLHHQKSIIKSLSSQCAFDILMIATVCLVIDFLYRQPLIPSIYI